MKPSQPSRPIAGRIGYVAGVTLAVLLAVGTLVLMVLFILVLAKMLWAQL